MDAGTFCLEELSSLCDPQVGLSSSSQMVALSVAAGRVKQRGWEYKCRLHMDLVFDDCLI